MQTLEPLWLAIDQGTQFSRAAVINGRGELIEICQVSVSLNRISDSEIEQDGTEIVESVLQAIQQVTSKVDESRATAAVLQLGWRHRFSDLGLKTSILRLSGGVTASRAVCQKLADLTRCPIVRPDESESTLLGVARLLVSSFGESKSVFKNRSSEQATFEPSSNCQLQERYQAFQRLLSEKSG